LRRALRAGNPYAGLEPDGADVAGKVAAVVVAGGRGLRAGGELPKQYRQICGESVIRRALLAFARHPEISIVQPVIHPADKELYLAATQDMRLLPAVAGAELRQGSVRGGL
jgi:2-C-methyl-D-erythritol 4-phosphate cytidylyltransferase / 2-C-methyl-D-erythritol 2,4-cyclodiphosphate synthase